MSIRLAIYVEDDIPEKLLALADSQRKQGDFVSRLIRSAWETQHVTQVATLDSLRLQMIGIIAELHELKGRLTTMEGKVSNEPAATLARKSGAAEIKHAKKAG